MLSSGRPAMRPIRLARTPAALIAAAAFAVGCATGQGDSAPTGDVLSGDCNPALTGGIGAAIGAILGGSKHRGEGAAAGAAIGALACVAYNYYAKQTKTSEQVASEYKAKNKGTLPPGQRGRHLTPRVPRT